MADNQNRVEEDGDDEGFELLIADDTPEGDQGKEPIPEEALLEDGEEDALEAVSDRVKKRIDKLTKARHDERRRAEQAEREAQAAAEATRVLYEKLRTANEVIQKFEVGFVDQAKGRTEAELAEARREFKAAFEMGDADKMADAQERIARLAPQHEQYSRYKPRPIEEPEPQAPRPSVPPAQNQTPPDHNLAVFMRENPWFNQDEEMTAYAMGLHQQASLKSPETVGTPEYYDYIARKVRSTFAHKMGDEDKPAEGKARPRTTPVMRNAPAQSGGRKKITLTASQVRLAARLGLTPQQYAESLIEHQGN